MLEAFPAIANRSSVDELPDIRVERAEFLLDFKHGTCVGHGSFDFETVANNAGIFQKGFDFTFVVTRNFGRLEIIECLAVVLTFVQDGLPAQPRLGVIEHEQLEQLTIIMDRRAPFVVVVFDHKLIVAGPFATFFHGLFSI